LPELVQQLVENTKDVSLSPFAAELAICATIIVLLLVRLFDSLRWLSAWYLALAGSIVSFALALAPALQGPPSERIEIFTGMLVFDTFSIYVRSFLLAFAVLFVVFTKLSGIPRRGDGTDFYALFFGSTLGMCLMASANHMLTVFLAVEMASVPSYVMAGLIRQQRSSEAALKYSIYGAGTAGVMVYGISLLSGVTHSAHIPTMAAQLAEMIHNGQLEAGHSMVLALGALMVMVGLAFKLSAVPFHFWCPDVFEGAAAEVGAFLSVASKGAALALLVRVALGFSLVPSEYFAATVPVASQGTVTQAESGSASGGLMNIADEEIAGKTGGETAPSADDIVAAANVADTDVADTNVADDGGAGPSNEGAAAAEPPQTYTQNDAVRALTDVRSFLALLIGVVAAVTCTFGNLAAYAQTNMKRLLAYSTIAHAGYMMMAVPPAIMLVGLDSAAGQAAIGALLLYLAIYLFMNLGAFAIVALLRNQLGSEEIDDYGGLIKHCPGVVVCMAILLFSLVGLPPLAGFIGKFAIFASLVDGYRATAAAGTAATFLIVLLVIGGVNTAISLFYYLRVVKVMTIDPEPEDRAPVNFPLVSLSGAYIALISAPILFLIVTWDGINQLARAAAEHLM